jgi:ribosomal protein L37E/predicted O-methyltransferase YrrM
MLEMLSSLARATTKNETFRRLALRLRANSQAAAVARSSELNRFERRVFSQNGEDGIIAELFARIPHERFFVEIGVEDGSECNTALLARQYGWSGVMIESDPVMFSRLERNCASLPVTCVRSLVDRENIADTLVGAGVPKSFDFLSIDIDGNDYYVWEALSAYSPKVVAIEYNGSFGPVRSQTIAYNPQHVWAGNKYYGASLTALAKLGDRLGYALVGTDRRGVNAFFVRRDMITTCGFPEKTPRQAWHVKPLLDNLIPSGTGEFHYP